MPPPEPPPPTFTTTLLPPPGPSILSIPIPPPPTPSPTTPLLIHAAHTLRTAVFIHEQHCPPANELDSSDPLSYHWVVLAHPPTSSPPLPVATLRLVPFSAPQPPHAPIPTIEEPNMAASEVWDRAEPFVMLGRLATMREWRGRGVARALVEEALGWAKRNREEVSRMGEGEGGEEWRGLVLIHAQGRLEGWYKGLGFVTDKGLGGWAEEGIAHVGMWRRV